jgi:DNA-binding HxlR family transcriptional regulator
MSDQDFQINPRGCVAAAATIIGSKWTPQILYALCSDVCRFCELQKEVQGINPRTLSARLDDLEAAGIVTREVHSVDQHRVEYSLTEKGKDLLPILEKMIEWGDKHPATV